MITKRWKLGLAVTLASVLVVTGCSSNGGTSTLGEEGASSKTAVGGENTVFPLKDPVNFKIVAVRNDHTKSEFEQIPAFQMIQKKTNVQIKWQVLTGQNKKEVMNLLLASGDYPDAFYGSGILDIGDQVKYGKEGVLIPLEELIAKYAPNLKKLYEARPDLKKKVTAPDGHMYFTPNLNEEPTGQIPSAFFINKAWLKEAGLDIPKTTDEFVNVLRVFKKNHADKIPLGAMFNDSVNSIISLGGSFGLPFHNKGFLVRNGQVQFAQAQPEYRSYAEYVHLLYKEGLLDPELPTQKITTYQAKMMNGDYGAFFTYTMDGMKPEIMDNYVAIPPLLGPKGDQLWTPSEGMPSPAFSITHVNKHPEIAIRWIDEMYTVENSLNFGFGMEGRAWNKVDGKYVMTDPPQGENDQTWRAKDSPGNFSAYALTKEAYTSIVVNKIKQTKVKLNEMYRPYVHKEAFPNSFMISQEDNKLISPIVADITGVNAYMDVTNAKWYLEGVTDAGWNAHQEQLKKMKLDTLLKTYQKYYDLLK